MPISLGDFTLSTIELEDEDGNTERLDVIMRVHDGYFIELQTISLLMDALIAMPEAAQLLLDGLITLPEEVHGESVSA